jgi:hypothetical protein
LEDEVTRKLEYLGLDGHHTPRVIEHKYKVEGPTAAALGRTRWPWWLRWWRGRR